MSVSAPAKVNLLLEVLGRRSDGFHEIDTVIQQLEFGDEVEVALSAGAEQLQSVREALGARTGRVAERVFLDAGELSIDVTNETGCDPGPPEGNLAVLAARRYLEAMVASAPRALGSLPLHLSIRLHKRIPVGSGLGGGSSDAAAVLRALDYLAGGVLGRRALTTLGAGLGSDVPAFLAGSPLIRAGGRGESVTPLPSLASRKVLIVWPAVRVSTADAYAALAARGTRASTRDRASQDHASRDHTSRDHDSRDHAFQDQTSRDHDSRDHVRLDNAVFGSWKGLGRVARNDFTPFARRIPEVARAHDALREMGWEPMLAGSGSACFGLARALAAPARTSGLGGDPNRSRLGGPIGPSFPPDWKIIETRTLDAVPEIVEDRPRP